MTKNTQVSIEDVGPLIAWLGEQAIQAADADQGKAAGMLTWAAQVIGECVDEDAPDPPAEGEVGEGPSDEAEASFTAWFCRNYPGSDTIIHRPELHAPKVFRAAACALARWNRPAAPPAEEVGEVGELVAWIHRQAVHGPGADEWRRAAELEAQP